MKKRLNRLIARIDNWSRRQSLSTRVLITAAIIITSISVWTLTRIVTDNSVIEVIVSITLYVVGPVAVAFMWPLKDD